MRTTRLLAYQYEDAKTPAMNLINTVTEVLHARCGEPCGSLNDAAF